MPGGELRRRARSTARIWSGLSYDNAIAVATMARDLLGLSRPQKRERVVDRLTRAELDQLMGHAYRVRGEYGLMIRTLVLTGCRVSEFVGLDVEDVDHERPAITVRRGKGGKSRVVPILPALSEQLRLWTSGQHRGRGPLFRSRHRTRYSRRRVQRIVQLLSADAGLQKRVYPHLMRHTVAQLLLEGGMPLEQVQIFLGHSKIDTTQIYARSSDAMIRDSYRKALTP